MEIFQRILKPSKNLVTTYLCLFTINPVHLHIFLFKDGIRINTLNNLRKCVFKLHFNLTFFLHTCSTRQIMKLKRRILTQIYLLCLKVIRKCFSWILSLILWMTSKQSPMFCTFIGTQINNTNWTQIYLH